MAPEEADAFLSDTPDALDRAVALHPGTTGNHYGHDYDPRPVFRFETPFAALPPGADENTMRDYARHWMATLPLDLRSIEVLLAVANELKAQPRPLGPCALLAAMIPAATLRQWALNLLDAICSPGFVALSQQDKETLARLHAACVARMEGATITPTHHARGARHRRARVAPGGRA